MKKEKLPTQATSKGSKKCVICGAIMSGSRCQRCLYENMYGVPMPEFKKAGDVKQDKPEEL